MDSVCGSFALSNQYFHIHAMLSTFACTLFAKWKVSDIGQVTGIPDSSIIRVNRFMSDDASLSRC